MVPGAFRAALFWGRGGAPVGSGWPGLGGGFEGGVVAEFGEFGDEPVGFALWVSVPFEVVAAEVLVAAVVDGDHRPSAVRGFR